MIIGTDLDGVLVDSVIPVVELAERNTGIKVPDGKRDWYFSTFPELLRKEIQRLFRDDAFMNNTHTFHGVASTLLKWKDAGHIVYIITARVPEIRENTKKMVDRMFGGMYAALYYVDIGKPKTDLMRQLKLQIWIDDSSHGAKESCELGIRTFLIHNKYTAEYNQCVIGELPVVPIKVISDIVL
jgi:beta-phosphoglucomutase-like phosphatase (HAD superfamily)